MAVHCHVVYLIDFHIRFIKSILLNRGGKEPAKCSRLLNAFPLVTFSKKELLLKRIYAYSNTSLPPKKTPL